jgi:uncharacterized Rmd1/YagE family protein
VTDRDVFVHAYGFAGTLRPKEAAEDLGTPKRVTKTCALAALGGDGFAVAYDFGAVVFFDVPAAEREAVLARILARLPPEPHAPLVDDYRLDVRAGAALDVGFDRATVAALDESVLELVGLVLAQSVAMDYYDEDVALLFQQVDAFASELALRGKLPSSRRELVRFVGRAVAMRNRVLLTLSLVDAPPVTWEKEVSDRLYRALRTTFEIGDRYRAFEHKLHLIQENLEIFVDLVHERRSVALELTVIALIVVELLLAIFRH